MKIQNVVAVLIILFGIKANALTSFELHNINEAHAQGYTGKSVNLGIVDTFFNQNHELLASKYLEVPMNNYLQWGYSFYHGSHVAGIAVGAKTDGANYGIANGAKFLAYGNLGSGVSNTDFDKMLAYNVKIINNSHKLPYQKFVEYAKGGILIVYASANDAKLSPTNAALRGIGSVDNLGAWLSVGNVNPKYITRDESGQLSVRARAFGYDYSISKSIFNSNSSNLCFEAGLYCIMAAGTEIKSATEESQTSYIEAVGTSQAAPVVSGIAALVAEKYPFLDGKQLADVILSTANKDFKAPKMIITYNREVGHTIYIDTPIPRRADGSIDNDKILADIAAEYGKTTEDMTSNKVVEATKEDVFGQGIVDAAKALKGLAIIDINRLSNLNVENFTGKDIAFYTINTKGYNALFENDIEQKKWDNKYHNENVKTLIGPQMLNLDAGLIKTGKGVLGISGNLNYLGATIVSDGELHLLNSANKTSLSVAGDVFVGQNGVLSTDTDVSVAKNLSNEGIISIGVNSTNLLSVNGTYMQKQGSMLKLSFLVDNVLNSALKAKSYDIQGGMLIYKPLSASVANRTLTLNLQGLENSLANFTQIQLDTSGYALKYKLGEDKKSLIIMANANVYADFEGANESLAKILRQMSNANISSAYQIFFANLNSMEFNEYKATLQALDEKAHLQQNKQLLLTQSTNTLANVLQLQSSNTEWLFKPHYSTINSKQISVNHIGMSIYANKINAWTTFSGFLHYGTLLGETSQKMNSQSLSLGVGVKNKMRGFELFGGASFGGALNNIQKESKSLKYNALFVSSWVGVDEQFALNSVKLIPTAFFSYHLFHQGKITDNGKALFSRQIDPYNSHFLSLNAGLNLSQTLSQAFHINAYGFYERRILGKDFQSKAEFKDFTGKFTQIENLSTDFTRFGLNVMYEKKRKQRHFTRIIKGSHKVNKVRETKIVYKTSYFVSLGLETEFSLNDDEYKGFGGNLRIGVNFN